MESRTLFPRSQHQIYAWFRYQGFPTLSVVNVNLFNGTVNLQQTPVILMETSGSKGIEIKRPPKGWIKGTYQVVLTKGQEILKSTSFKIDD